MTALLDSPEITDFQRRVYQATSEIPFGRVTTYKWLGLAIGCHSPRAVGQALRRCPLAPEIPCHRVVAAGPSIGGYGGRDSGPDIAHKRALLEAEGVYFEEDLGLKNRAQLFTFGLESS